MNFDNHVNLSFSSDINIQMKQEFQFLREYPEFKNSGKTMSFLSLEKNNLHNIIKYTTMKTSMIIIAALLLNTTLLVAEPLSTFVKGINPFILIVVEALLVLGYFTNKWLSDLNKACTMDFGYLDIFVLKSK